MMKTFFRKSLVLGSLLVAAIVFAQSTDSGKITIAVIDAPVDFEHEMIKPYLDLETLESLETEQDGKTLSWNELNKQAIEKMQSRVKQGQFDLAARFIDSTARMMGFDPKDKSKGPPKIDFKAVGKGLFMYLFSPSFRRQVDIAGTLLHGSHVAGIAVKNLSSVRLITYPLIGEAGDSMGFRDLWKLRDAEKFRAEQRAEFEAITKGLSETNTRVVNLSIGSSYEMALKKFNKKLGLVKRILTTGLRQSVAKKAAKVYIEELERFIRANPKTVFVLAAGNEKAKLNLWKLEGKMHTAMITAPNLVKVGAVKKAGDNKLASFSNSGEEFVDIAAEGVGNESAKLGGGTMAMMGTSMAAPEVTNRLAKILAQNPGLSAEDAIDELLDNHTVQIEEGMLKYQVADGLTLSAEKYDPSKTLSDLGDLLGAGGGKAALDMKPEAMESYRKLSEALAKRVAANKLDGLTASRLLDDCRASMELLRDKSPNVIWDKREKNWKKIDF